MFKLQRTNDKIPKQFRLFDLNKEIVYITAGQESNLNCHELEGVKVKVIP